MGLDDKRKFIQKETSTQTIIHGRIAVCFLVKTSMDYFFLYYSIEGTSDCISNLSQKVRKKYYPKKIIYKSGINAFSLSLI